MTIRRPALCECSLSRTGTSVRGDRCQANQPMAHFSTAPRERSLKRCSPHGGRAAMEEWLMATENAKRMQQTDDAWNGRDWDAVRPAP